MAKTKGPYTVKKNIARESARYLLKHQTPKLISALAENDERQVGTYLDRLVEAEARKVLPADRVEQIIKEGQEEEARRLAEAERLIEAKQVNLTEHEGIQTQGFEIRK
jgi:hypothetical protein